MKKTFITLLLGICILFSAANAESDITFHGIPWLSDDTTTIQALFDAGLLREKTDISFSKDNNVYIVTDDEIYYRPDVLTGNELVCYSASLKKKVKGKIAGYPINDISLTFAYDGEYKLIAVKIDLMKSDYFDILSKLTKVYGQGQNAITEDLIESTIWKGDNNSAILLYTQSEGYQYTLIYGRTDAAEILSNCLVQDPNDVSGL